MNITHLLASDLKSISAGGIASYVRGLIRAHRKSGLNLSFVGVTGDREDSIDMWAKKSIDAEELMFLPVAYTAEKHLTYAKGVPLNAIFLLKLFINRKNIVFASGLLHIHRFEAAIPFLLFKKNIKIVLTIHGLSRAIEQAKSHPFYSKKWFKRLYYIAEKFVLHRVDKVILVSQEGMDYYVQKYSDYKEKFILIPTFVDTSLFSIENKKIELRKRYKLSPDGKIILFAGRFDYLKGLDLLIESFQKLRQEVRDSTLLLVGDGREKNGLKKKVLDLGIEGVEFRDMVSHDELPQIMNCADIYALTSLWEGMPLVALEAMACGIPVVSTDVGQLGEIVKDGSTGYLVAARSAAEFALKMRLCMDGAPSMTSSCRAMAEKYSLPVIADRILTVYREI